MTVKGRREADRQALAHGVLRQAHLAADAAYRRSHRIHTDAAAG